MVTNSTDHGILSTVSNEIKIFWSVKFVINL